MAQENKKLTETYTSFEGNKLLNHLDTLYGLQAEKKLRPIMAELCPTEACESDCPFCSVAGRPIKSSMPFDLIRSVLQKLSRLGAKSIEITGGGNPLLYRDKETKATINDVINYAHNLGLSVGLITNSHDLKRLDPDVFPKISWLRLSLIQLDEGKEPEDYNFHGFPEEKLAFSYILYDSTGGVPDPLSRTSRPYAGTTTESIRKIARLIDLYPNVKFCRVYGNCLIKGGHPVFQSRFEDVLKELDSHGKAFIKEIGEDEDNAFNDSCLIGGLRPYIAPSPEGGEYHVYPCNSFVLNTRTYDLDYSLGRAENILEIWQEMNRNLKTRGYPYEVKGNKGTNWQSTCRYCFFSKPNKLLHQIAFGQPDSEFI